MYNIKIRFQLQILPTNVVLMQKQNIYFATNSSMYFVHIYFKTKVDLLCKYCCNNQRYI